MSHRLTFVFKYAPTANSDTIIANEPITFILGLNIPTQCESCWRIGNNLRTDGSIYAI